MIDAMAIKMPILPQVRPNSSATRTGAKEREKRSPACSVHAPSRTCWSAYCRKVA
jgi:hypothetical protein